MKLNKIFAGIAIVVVLALVSTMLHAIGLLGNLQQSLSNYLYDEREVSGEVVVVGIDEATLADVDEGGMGGFGDWSRLYFGKVVSEIADAGAAVVMLDILFTEKARGISADAVIEMMDETGNLSDIGLSTLLYLEDPHPDDAALAEMFGLHDNIYLIKGAAGVTGLENGYLNFTDAVEPIEILDEVVKTGYANLGADESSSNTSTIYGIPAIEVVGGVQEEHIDLKLVREYLDLEDVEAFGDMPIQNGQMLINYAKGTRDWETVSFVDVYRGAVPAETFDGKIVLIGATTALLQDIYYTPIDQVTPMPGVEIHANAVQTILDGAYLQHQSTAGFLGLVVVMVALASGVALYAPVLAGVGVLVVEIVWFPMYANLSFGRGVIPDLIWPVFAVVAAYLAAMGYRNFTEFAEKRKLKSAFGHYVSPELVAQISANPDQLKLGGERRNISVMFLDIENFTSLSESLEAAEVVGIINTYFDALTGVIMQHGGTVDKFEGDAIMALFGAPVASADHGLAACKTALAIRAKIGELNKQTGQKLGIRIGIATGDAIVGNMGSAKRFDYTAMGDTVNVAARLEGGNKFYGTRVLVNDHAMAAAQEELSFRRIDRVRLKGKEEAINIFEVMGPRDAVSNEGVVILATWHEALEYYRNQQWVEVETRMRKVLKAIPTDGPAKAYLARIDWLKKNPMKAWDGTWGFDQK